MEIESRNGSKILLKEGSETIEFGRNLGVDSTDLTVSRRHIRFQLHRDQTSVGFEVIGKNPIWVRANRSGEIRVYRRSESGEMETGDSFSVSSKDPVWFHLKRIEYEDEYTNKTRNQLRIDDELAESSGIEDVEMETRDFSHIDPIKEFNFVVLGHEFDCYPKKMIRDVKNWDWFLDESGGESEGDEVNESKSKKGARRKRKKGGGDDDDEVWTGESEEDTEVIKKTRNVQRPKYATRSKDSEKNKKGASASKSTQQKDTTARSKRTREDEDEDEDEDDEDDDTLGGFIVDEDVEEDSGDDEEEEEEEEEEFEDDDDE